MSFREGTKVVAAGTALWFWGVFLFIGAAAAFYFVQPYFMARQRENVQQSLQYVTTQVQQLNSYRIAYQDLETKIAEAGGNTQLAEAYQSQQATIVTQMESLQVLIPAEEVPAEIRNFLAAH